jgi:hypothetical protein
MQCGGYDKNESDQGGWQWQYYRFENIKLNTYELFLMNPPSIRRKWHQAFAIGGGAINGRRRIGKADHAPQAAPQAIINNTIEA